MSSHHAPKGGGALLTSVTARCFLDPFWVRSSRCRLARTDVDGRVRKTVFLWGDSTNVLMGPSIGWQPLMALSIGGQLVTRPKFYSVRKKRSLEGGSKTITGFGVVPFLPPIGRSCGRVASEGAIKCISYFEQEGREERGRNVNPAKNGVS